MSDNPLQNNELNALHTFSSDEELLNIGKIILIIAGADGEISENEMKYFLGFVRGLNANPEMLSEWKAFDWKNGSLNDYSEKIKDFGAPRCRWIVYHAVKTASADMAFTKEERNAILGIGRELGIDAMTMTAIESFAQLENAISKTRYELFGPLEVMPASPGEPVYTTTTQIKELLNIEFIGHDHLLAIGKVLLMIASADGEIAPEEMAYFNNFVKRMGAPNHLLKEWEQFDWEQENIEEHLHEIKDLGFPMIHRMLYISVKISEADVVYSKMEQLATTYVGQLMGINPKNIVNIQGVLKIERALSEAQYDLFFK